MYYQDLKGEKPITYKSKRWLYVMDKETGKHLYLCLGCDAPIDDKGYCIMCGGESPCVK